MHTINTPQHTWKTTCLPNLQQAFDVLCGWLSQILWPEYTYHTLVNLSTHFSVVVSPIFKYSSTLSDDAPHANIRITTMHFCRDEILDLPVCNIVPINNIVPVCNITRLTHSMQNSANISST